MPVDFTEGFGGRVLVIAPHMDDEVLACGGLMARLPHKEKVHVLYATDGMKSPAPVIPVRDSISPDLGALRMKESEAAVALLGVPRQNLTFLGLPEAQLREHRKKLKPLLLDHVASLDPDLVLMPFRYDRHPDHLAINQVITAAHRSGSLRAELMEYFVYYRWRLLPKKDIRKYVRPEYLLEMEIGEVASTKRAALDCFKTQTTLFYPWQTRPILTPKLLDEECVGPEVFLRFDPAAPGPAVFAGWVPWIRVVHRLEPRLQKWKYLAKSMLTRSLGGKARDAGSA